MGKYKILKMKDMAQKLKLKPSSSFGKTEPYLEYAIKEINEKSSFDFHQYLYLIDTLYVVLISKQSKPATGREHLAVDPPKETLKPLTQKIINKGMEEVKDKEYVKKNLKKIKLDWK